MGISNELKLVQAVKDWKSESYEDFGVQIGKMIYQLLIKSTYPEMQIYVESDQIALQIFEGVLVGKQRY